METLIVKNFLTLKDINFKVNSINILIGPQAEGKSLIAKLVYFFKIIPQWFSFSVFNQYQKKEFDNLLLRDFTDIFPSYSWTGNIFEIKYTYDNTDAEVIIYPKILKSKKTKLYIKYSDGIIKTFKKLKSKYSQYLKKMSLPQEKRDDKILIELNKEVADFFHGHLSRGQQIETMTYIPAGRSFFLNIKSNVWSFIKTGAEIEYFIKDFGNTFENMKKHYDQNRSIKQGNVPQLFKIVEQIIKGSYHFDKYADWIYSTKLKRPTWAMKTSSGQQEFVPMAVVLCALGAIGLKEYAQTFFIEEPEAHLFPDSQKLIVDLFGLLYNIDQRRLGLFITTHSPYILTALNNLIQADNTLQKIQNKPNMPDLKKKLFKIVPKNLMISFDHISSYYLFDGKVIDLLHKQNRIIDSNRIDYISNELQVTFNKLLDIHFEEI